MKIVVLDGVSLSNGDISWAGLEAYGELTVYEFTHPEEVLPRIEGAEIVFTNKTRLTGDMIRAAKDLRFIGVMATGYDVVDIEAAREQGIPVSNAPGYSTPAVAQLAMAFLLETAMQVGEYNRDVHAGKWINTPNHRLRTRPLVELYGKTLGIYGCGNIGRQVAKMAQGFGMRVIATSRRARPGTVREGITFVSKEELFAQSQFLSLNSPLNRESHHIVNRDTLALMPAGAVIVNTSRGGLVDAAAVAEALQAGQLGWYCADALEVEPMTADEVLLTAPRCLLTPHMAWATLESRQRLMDMCVEMLERFLDGKPVYVVN